MAKYDRLMTAEEITSEAKQLGNQIIDITQIPGDSLMVTLLLTCAMIRGNIAVLKESGTDSNTLETLQATLEALRELNNSLDADRANFTFNPENN